MAAAAGCVPKAAPQIILGQQQVYLYRSKPFEHGRGPVPPVAQGKAFL
jgi:hypothetical protein